MLRRRTLPSAALSTTTYSCRGEGACKSGVCQPAAGGEPSCFALLPPATLPSCRPATSTPCPAPPPPSHKPHLHATLRPNGHHQPAARGQLVNHGGRQAGGGGAHVDGVVRGARRVAVAAVAHNKLQAAWQGAMPTGKKWKIREDEGRGRAWRTGDGRRGVPGDEPRRLFPLKHAKRGSGGSGESSRGSSNDSRGGGGGGGGCSSSTRLAP